LVSFQAFAVMITVHNKTKDLLTLLSLIIHYNDVHIHFGHVQQPGMLVSAIGSSPAKKQNEKNHFGQGLQLCWECYSCCPEIKPQMLVFFGGEGRVAAQCSD
jgi:hypothetical protein